MLGWAVLRSRNRGRKNTVYGKKGEETTNDVPRRVSGDGFAGIEDMEND